MESAGGAAALKQAVSPTARRLVPRAFAVWRERSVSFWNALG
jgi:hypothetical protein